MDNSTSSPDSPSKPGSSSTVSGIFAPLGVIVVVTIMVSISYFFARRRWIANQSIRLSGAAAPSDHDTDDENESRLGLDDATILSYPMLLYTQAINNIKANPGTSSSSSSSSLSSSSSCSSSSSSSCSICLLDYKETDTVRILPECKHFFHVKCVDPWLKLNSTCPICRQSLIRPPNSCPNNNNGNISNNNDGGRDNPVARHEYSRPMTFFIY